MLISDSMVFYITCSGFFKVLYGKMDYVDVFSLERLLYISFAESMNILQRILAPKRSNAV